MNCCTQDESLTILARLVAPSLAAMLTFLFGMYVGRRSRKINHVDTYREALIAYGSGTVNEAALRDAHRHLPRAIRARVPVDQITKASPDDLKREIELCLEELR